MNPSLYTPSNWGHEFHHLPHHEALGAGSAGPGKSLVLLMDPIYQVVAEHQRCSDPKHEHHIPWGMSVGWALHLRRSMPMLEQTIRRSHRIFPFIDPQARYLANTHTWIFASGFHYQFGHCKDTDSWEQYHSAEFTHIAFDELVQFEEEQYEQITTRLRCTDPVLKNMLKVRSMSNPLMKVEAGQNFTVKNPHWVRERFVDPAPAGRKTLYKEITLASGEVTKRTRIYLPATLYDNPDPEFVRQYEETLRAKPAHIQKAMLYGDWYVAPGSYYGDSWLNNMHIIAPFHIPDDWPQFRSLDWGFKAPGCCHWWAVDPDGNCYVHRELTFQGKDVHQVAAEIKKVELELKLWKGRSLITGPADNQLWEQRGDIGRAKYQEFAERGITWVKADKRSRARNAQLLLSRIMDHRNQTTTPGIVFFNTCKNAIRTIPVIPTDPKNPEAPMDGGEDHWHDSVLYGCAYASRPRAGSPAKRPREINDYQPRGRWGYGMY